MQVRVLSVSNVHFLWRCMRPSCDNDLVNTWHCLISTWHGTWHTWYLWSGLCGTEYSMSGSPDSTRWVSGECQMYLVPDSGSPGHHSASVDTIDQVKAAWILHQVMTEVWYSFNRHPPGHIMQCLTQCSGASADLQLISIFSLSSQSIVISWVLNDCNQLLKCWNHML